MNYRYSQKGTVQKINKIAQGFSIFFVGKSQIKKNITNASFTQNISYTFLPEYSPGKSIPETKKYPA